MWGFISCENLTLGTQGLLLVFPATLCLTGVQAGQGEGGEGPWPSSAGLFCPENSFPGSTCQTDGWVGKQGTAWLPRSEPPLDGLLFSLNNLGPPGKKRPLGVPFFFQTPAVTLLVELRCKDQVEQLETPGPNAELSSLRLSFPICKIRAFTRQAQGSLPLYDKPLPPSPPGSQGSPALEGHRLRTVVAPWIHCGQIGGQGGQGGSGEPRGQGSPPPACLLALVPHHRLLPLGQGASWEYVGNKQGTGGLFIADDHSFPLPLIRQQTQRGRLERALCGLRSTVGAGGRGIGGPPPPGRTVIGLSWGAEGGRTGGPLSSPGRACRQDVSEPAA